MPTMFKIKKLTKYAFFALALTIIFIAVPNSAKAGDDTGDYFGTGYEDMGSFSTDNTSTGYYPQDTTTGYYPQDTVVAQSTGYYPQDTVVAQSTGYYPQDTVVAQSTGYYPQDTSYYNYQQPTYQSGYYGSSGCSSCGYTYTPPPQIYVPPYVPPQQPPYVPPVQTLDATCVISPNNVNVNDTVTLSGSATGGSGVYSYYWSGSDGISGSSQVITGRFTSPGSKTVSLTVNSGNQTVTRTCNAYVNTYNYNYNYNYNGNYNYNNNYNNGYNYNYTNVTATCVATPINARVGDNVIWTVYPTGGNGGAYTYSWTGTDGLSYGNANQIQQRYTTPGTKTATVTVYSTYGQSIVATCSTNVIGSVVQGTPISGIYLNEVPATGINFNLKVALYALGMILWSAFVGFMIVERKKAKLALANRGKIEDFKQDNLRKKGLL